MDCLFEKTADGTKWHCIRTACQQCDLVVRSHQTRPPHRGRCCEQPGEKTLDRCKFLGDKLGTQECQGCQGTVRIKLFACEVHGKTALGKKLDGLSCCANCPDYAPSKRDADADDGRAG